MTTNPLTDITPTVVALADKVAKIQTEVDEVVAAGEIVPLLTTFQTLTERLAHLKEVQTKLSSTVEYLSKNAIPKAFEAAGTDLVRVPELKKSFYPLQKYSASVKDKDALYDWLRKNGDGDLITETVNASTLATYLKGKVIDEGIDPPEEIVALNTYQITGSSTYTPK